MNSKIAALVVLVVLVLSMGPLGFFSGSAKDIDVPQNDTKSFYETTTAAFTGIVTDITPVIIYTFTSDRLDDSFVIERMKKVPNLLNYSISEGINPNGPGYQ